MIELEVNVIRHFAVNHPTNHRIESIVFRTLEAECADGEWVVSVVFVGDDEIQRMHRGFMGIDQPTDILTFPTTLVDDGAIGGDIVISVETACAQGCDHGNDQIEELEFLIVHGMLHLLGWYDNCPEDRERMLRRQSEILEAIP